MSYIQRLLDKKRDEPKSGTSKTSETPLLKVADSPSQEPAKPAKPGSDGFAGTLPDVSPDFTTPWPPRPKELASWPIAWREKWGLLANRLEEEGVPFPESERRAFDEMKASRGGQAA